MSQELRRHEYMKETEDNVQYVDTKDILKTLNRMCILDPKDTKDTRSQ